MVQVIGHFAGLRYGLVAYVVMDDHIHLIATPLQDWSLEKLVYSWKSFSAKRMVREFGRKSPFWQGEYYDHIIRNELDLNEKLGYILTNPQRRWPEIIGYKWVWASFYDK